jgi:geranylgeranyl pyrophosphate synthase
VKGIADNPALADEVRAFVMEHQGVEKAIVKMYDYVQEAISSLASLPESKEKSYLVQLARFVADRNN